MALKTPKQIRIKIRSLNKKVKALETRLRKLRKR